MDEMEQLEATLLETLRANGGGMGNMALMARLGWSPDQYWEIRNRLVEAGALKLGRGRGGSVRLAHQEPLEERTPEVETEREDTLYQPLKDMIKEHWARSQRLDEYEVEICASQGRRKTGGTWSRPDIVLVSSTVLPYVPGKHIEVTTFEIKTWHGLDVTAVYEALSHSRSAHKSYVISKVPAELSEEDSDYIDSITDEAKRHGIGFITISDVSNLDTWEEKTEARFRDPDPHLLNDFISVQLSEFMKSRILKWIR